MLFLLFSFLLSFLFPSLSGSEDHGLLAITELDDVNKSRMFFQLCFRWQNVLPEVGHVAFAVFQILGILRIFVSSDHGIGAVRARNDGEVEGG